MKLDVVTVPDFSGKARLRFEFRTLFFLASWREAGCRGEMEIACIGEPPESVEQLAWRVGARISIHDPLPGDKFANKRRAFDTQRRANWLLLLDTDILFLRPLALRDLTEIPAVYAAPVDRPKIDPALWPLLYEHLGLPQPKRRIALIRGRMDPAFVRSYPYYNGGVLLMPWSVVDELGETWAQHNAEIHAIAGIRGLERAADQEGLATALSTLALETRILPDIYNARWRHLYLGHPRLEEAHLFHATGFLSRYNGGSLRPHLLRYSRVTQRKFLRAFREAPRRSILSALRDARALIGRLQAFNLSLGNDRERGWRRRALPSNA